MVILLALLSALQVSDYDVELRRFDDRIAVAASATERAVYTYRLAALTGDFAQFREAETAIETALRDEPSREMVLLRANLNFKMHRLRRAKDDLARVGDTKAARTLAAQIALQEGDYQSALDGYNAAIASDRAWDGLASLAYYRANTGERVEADRLYVEAQDQITAKEMSSYAWVELQRGLLELEQGHDAEALSHYRRAEKAYSGYWLIEEHIAEVLDRLGQTAEAVALYRRIIAKTENPEYISALARIVGRDDPSAAAHLFAEADALYDERMRLYPEAAGGHLIRDLLARADASPTRLMALAEANVELRPNAEAKLLLAKAYWKANRPTDAKRLLAEVKQTPWRTAEATAFEREVETAGAGSSPFVATPTGAPFTP